MPRSSLGDIWLPGITTLGTIVISYRRANNVEKSDKFSPPLHVLDKIVERFNQFSWQVYRVMAPCLTIAPPIISILQHRPVSLLTMLNEYIIKQHRVYLILTFLLNVLLKDCSCSNVDAKRKKLLQECHVLYPHYHPHHRLDYDDCHTHHDLQLFTFCAAMLFKQPCHWAHYSWV